MTDKSDINRYYRTGFTKIAVGVAVAVPVGTITYLSVDKTITAIQVEARINDQPENASAYDLHMALADSPMGRETSALCLSSTREATLDIPNLLGIEGSVIRQGIEYPADYPACVREKLASESALGALPVMFMAMAIGFPFAIQSIRKGLAYCQFARKRSQQAGDNYSP